VIDIKKYYLFCMGEGYLDKRRYSEDLGHEKQLQRVVQDNQDQTLRQALQLRSARLAGGDIPLQQPLFPQPTGLQQTLLTVLRPVQVVVANLRALMDAMMQRLAQGNQAAPKGNVLEKLMSQMFVFFFGTKKSQLDEKEKEKREAQDFADSDIFGKRVVEGANGSGFSSGQR
jgi:hypothetical protein